MQKTSHDYVNSLPLILPLPSQCEQTIGDISDFCSTQNIVWKFIPECAPHFEGLWEAAVKSMKFHFKQIVGNTKLTFEELMTVLTQIESCLNSRPLAPLPCDEDGIEALTPGHFLIGQPLKSIPDPSVSYQSFFLFETLVPLSIDCPSLLEEMV